MGKGKATEKEKEKEKAMGTERAKETSSEEACSSSLRLPLPH